MTIYDEVVKGLNDEAWERLLELAGVDGPAERTRMTIKIPGLDSHHYEDGNYKGAYDFEAYPLFDRGAGSFQLEVTDSYEAPPINFDFLLKLSEHFGTTAIDVDDHSIDQGGCDTCDYGSRYGHTIQVLNPTRNIPEFAGAAS